MNCMCRSNKCKIKKFHIRCSLLNHRKDRATGLMIKNRKDYDNSSNISRNSMRKYSFTSENVTNLKGNDHRKVTVMSDKQYSKKFQEVMEKMDCQNKANGYTNKNFPNKEKEIQNTKSRVELTEDETEDEGEDEDKELTKSDNRNRNGVIGLCALCHLTVDKNMGILTEPRKTFSCSRKHFLCGRCEGHFVIRPDAGCVLCGIQSQNSNIHFMEESNSHVQSYLTIYGNGEQLLHTEGSYGNLWNDNHMQENNSINCGILEPYSKEERENLSNSSSERTFVCGRQQHSYCSIIKKQNHQNSNIRANGQMSLECSRRPIRCPRIDCAVNVAFSALTHHFLFDHPEVPILNVDPGTISTLVVSFEALSCDSSQCLALLLVSGKLSDSVGKLFNGNQMHPKYRNRLPLPVLAARLRCMNHYASSDKIHVAGKAHNGRDVIIAWVAGLDVRNTTEKLRCSIQAVNNVDSEEFRSLTYTGPVNSLRSTQCPQDVFLNGDCIVLHEGLINRITSGCTRLNVNIIVH